MRPAWLEIDLSAVEHNVAQIRRLIGPRVRLIAVVKANAYGHGDVRVAERALAAGADMLAVALVQEAVALREAGLAAPILVLLATDADEAEALAQNRLIASLCELSFARALNATAGRIGLVTECHVKLDSGMGRQGVRADAAEDFGQALCGLPGLRISGAFSHFASCGTDPGFTAEQFECYGAGLAALERGLGRAPGLRHLAASAGILQSRQTWMDAVRPGAILYGIADHGYEEHLPRFRQAMTLKARIVATKRLHAGESVGYGRTFVAREPTRTALLPVGYADGYPRSLSNAADALVHGRRCPVIGRVSMDCLMLDIGCVPKAQVGDEVVLLGRQGNEMITAGELADRAGSCVQEIVSRMSSRLPRVFLN